MAFGSFQSPRPAQMMSEINVTPMVDVMLVLLVIFILAAPLFSQSVQLELPKTAAVGAARETAAVHLAIDAAGQVYWNNDKLDAATLEARLAAAAARSPQPELQLRADRATRYEAVARLMAAAQAKGLTQLGFITDTEQEAGHGTR
ncbi:biopolymer transporter ExbD [Massilia sp. TS11]|uniref:ExbD/TolR family protein n=1 Tax=Massilia sp. TS11 TaxID=2908003 RepID=UPI001EDB2441|nr:biopolymer transporter ExbD [Massilia sp. TS11]MCG2586378.1 biopolymer transporter ExbD [Massilia sp. TS11]